jgi:regulator of sigma E protease
MLTYVLSAIVVLGVLIIVHEWGHFYMARKMGVGVEKFSIGFGRPLWTKIHNGTEFIVAWIPFGGYVKMVGDEEGEDVPPPENPEEAFNNKPIWRRLLIVVAGPLANLIFAALLFAVVYMVGVDVPDTKLKTIVAGSPAHAVGLKVGDRILEIDGVVIKDWNHLAEIIGGSADNLIELTVESENGAISYISVTPEAQSSKTIFGEDIRVGRIGISHATIFKRYNPVHALYLGAEKTVEIIYLTGLVIVKMVQNVVPANTIGGPLMIFKIAGDQAQAGIIPLLMFMAVLSVNLGFLNLLPIPILDGGHIVFFLIEAAKGGPISIKGREIAQQVGMFLLISLMVFAFYNDITRFISGG